MRKGVWLFIFLIFLFAQFSVAETISNSIPIQIQTLDESGNPIAGTYTFKIDISNSATCSPILYTNTTILTTDSRGLVSYNLENIDLSFDEQYWFCYYRDSVLKATIKAARVPYAFNAKNVDLSGINIDDNFNLGSYNLSADRVIVNQICNSTDCFNLEDLTSGGDGNFSNYANYSFYWNDLISFNSTQMENSNGVLNILTSWLQSLFYTREETYNKTEVDDLILGSGDSLWTNVSNVATYDGVVNITESLYVNGTQITGSNIPTGMISAFNSESCPTGWVLADGSNGTPDLRGIFIRGSGTSGVLSTANGTAFSSVYGTYGNDSFQGHWHQLFRYLEATSSQVAGATIGVVDGTPATQSTRWLVKDPITDGTNGNPRTGSETTPAYYSTIYCVKTGEDSEASNSIWGISGNNVLLNNQSKSLNLSNTQTEYYSPVSGEESVGTMHFRSGDLPSSFSVTTSSHVAGSPFEWDLSSVIPDGTESVEVFVRLTSSGGDAGYVWDYDAGAFNVWECIYRGVYVTTPASNGAVNSFVARVKVGPSRKLYVAVVSGATISVAYRGYTI